MRSERPAQPERPARTPTSNPTTSVSASTSSPETRNESLQLSLFFLIDHYPDRGQSLHRRIGRHVELAERAEDLGYHGVFVAEHHFSDFGAAPNPAVVLAAMAARTQTLRLGPAVAVLPLRHPLQVVEDYGLVDQISEGRLVLGVGSGSVSSEFAGFGLDIADKRQVFDENLDAVRRAFSDSGSDGSNGWGKQYTPGGVLGFERRTPPILVASTSVDGARTAGRRGLGLLTLASPGTASLEEVVERLEAHSAAFAEKEPAAGKPEQVVTVMAHFADCAERARAEAAPALERFLRTHGDPDADGFAVYDRMVDQGIGAFGTPADVRERLRPLLESGARHLSLWMGFGDLGPRELESSMALARQLSSADRLAA